MGWGQPWFSRKNRDETAEVAMKEEKMKDVKQKKKLGGKEEEKK